MEPEEILEAITVEVQDEIYVNVFSRKFSPEKLAAFLAKHLTNKDT